MPSPPSKYDLLSSFALHRTDCESVVLRKKLRISRLPICYPPSSQYVLEWKTLNTLSFTRCSMKDASERAAYAKREDAIISTPFHEAITKLRTRVILRKAMTIGVWSLYCGYTSVEKSTEVHNTAKGERTMESKCPGGLRVAVWSVPDRGLNCHELSFRAQNAPPEDLYRWSEIRVESFGLRPHQTRFGWAHLSNSSTGYLKFLGVSLLNISLCYWNIPSAPRLSDRREDTLNVRKQGRRINK